MRGSALVGRVTTSVVAGVLVGSIVRLIGASWLVAIIVGFGAAAVVFLLILFVPVILVSRGPTVPAATLDGSAAGVRARATVSPAGPPTHGDDEPPRDEPGPGQVVIGNANVSGVYFPEPSPPAGAPPEEYPAAAPPPEEYPAAAPPPSAAPPEEYPAAAPPAAAGAAGAPPDAAAEPEPEADIAAADAWGSDAGSAAEEPLVTEPPAGAWDEVETLYYDSGMAASVHLDGDLEEPADVDQPPRSAYARLDAPDATVMQKVFEISVGLASRPSKDVIAEPLKVPDAVVGPYTLTVQVVADGFSLADGNDWRVDMPVTAREPYPVATMLLVADTQDAPVRARTLQALYEIDGQTIGLAYRSIAVVRDPALLAQAPAATTEPGFDMAVPEGEAAPDLTVRIVRGEEEQAGRLLWTFSTRHEIEVPHEEVVRDIGDEPEAFASRLIKKMPSYEGKEDLYDYVVGVGDLIAENVPDEFWMLLAAVAHERPTGPPSVLFLSAEAYVPWELARMEEPLDVDAPPLLSAQARVGRWVLGKRNRPKVPPPSSAQARSMAVVFGVYDVKKWRRLVEAEREAADLQTQYGALPVNADKASVLRCIKGNPPADILHFSVHGKSDHSGLEDGLVMIDGQVLDPAVVWGQRFDASPFVFLNACQLGMGDEVLGDYAGMAAAFLHAGAAGVIAPLWSVDDVAARELALEFYDQTFEGVMPAELLRQKRSTFMEELKPTSSTFVAYQFFGHPEMRFRRETDG
jgi:hypothetical protein